MGTVKYTGPVASFHCPTNAEIRSLKVHFSPKQEGSGDPSPENVREIVGWDGVEVYRNGSTTNYEFGVLGKNKFNKNDSGKIISGVQVLSAGKIGGSSTSTTVFIPCFSNTSYTISKLATARAAISYATTNTLPQIDDSVYGYQNTANQSTATITTGDNAKWLCIYITNTTYDSTSIQDILDSLQVELGSTATAYEPYNPNHTVYGGWVDLISGEVVATHGCSILTGSEQNWAWSTSSNGIAYLTISDMKSGMWYTDDGTLCDSAIKTNSATSGGLKCLIGYNNNRIYIYNSTTEIQGVTDLESFQTWLSTHNITITYPIATPNTYYLAPTQLQTFLGQNNVWSNADYVEIEYDLHETQDILARKQFIVANQPHIVKPAAAPLQNFVTDVPAPLKECKVHFAPVQDLHGYSNPWPAGGGKNIAKPYDNNYISSTYVSFDYSAANGTFRCYGTASASSTHSSPSATNAANNGATFTLPAGTYTLSIIDGDGANIYAQCVSSTETVLAETTSHITFTTNEALTVFVRLKVAAGATVDNTVKIQLEAGSTATSYVPYENICPISGRTGLTCWKTGKNLIDESYLANANNYPNAGNYGYYYTDDIQLVPNTNYRFVWSNYDSSKLNAVLLYVSGANQYIVDNNVTKGYRQYTSGFTTSSTGIIKFGINKQNYSTIQDALDAIFTNGDLLLQLGTNDESYEPYTGTIIPVAFPATKNLFDPTSTISVESLQSGNTRAVCHTGIYGGTFTISASRKDTSIATEDSINYGYFSNNTVTVVNAFITSAKEFTSTITLSNDEELVFSFISNNTTTFKTQLDKYYVQIEVGSTATSYEPYGIIYGGYLDLVSGEVVQTHYLASVLKSQFGNQITPSTSNGMPYRQTIPLFPDAASGTSWVTARQQQIFNYGKIANPWSETTYGNYVGVIITSNNGTYMRISEDIYQTLSDNDRVEISYELATPITYQIDQTTLKALCGTNNIWANNNSENIEVAYWRH